MPKLIKKILPPLIIILACIIIIFIGGPKKTRKEVEPLTPLVFQSSTNHLYGAVDTKRKVIIEPKYKTLFAKQLDGEYYFIGTTESNETDIMTDEGKILDRVPSNYINVSVLSLKDKLLEVSNNTNNFIGVINFQNQTIIPMKYNTLSFKNDFLILNPLSNESIANKNGKILVSSKDYSSVTIEDNGIVVTNKKGLYGLLDFNGNVVLEPTYNNIHGVYGNIFAVGNNNGNYALYNLVNRNFISSFKYTYIQKEAKSSPFLACKVYNGVSLYGYVDSRGSTVIPFEFQSGYAFTDNYAIVQQNGVYGLIDKSGNFLIKPKYTIIPGNAYAIESFQNGNYYVGYLDNKSYIMNSNGEVIADVPGVVQTISNQTVFYQTTDNKDFLYNLNTKKTMSVNLYLMPLSKGTLTPDGYFGAYKNVSKSKFVNSMYLYEEGKGIISQNGYNSIKFENGLFICKSEKRYDLLKPDGRVLISFDPVNILNISVTPDGLIYVQKVNPAIGNRMHTTVAEQQNTRLISLYNIKGEKISFEK